MTSVYYLAAHGVCWKWLISNEIAKWIFMFFFFFFLFFCFLFCFVLFFHLEHGVLCTGNKITT